MTLAVRLHNTIEQYNILKKPTDAAVDYFKKNPTLYKVALFVDHLFRAAMMFFCMNALPLSALATVALCIGGSLFYRLTAEHKCPYKFALPSLGGAVALSWAQIALNDTVLQTALSSLSSFAIAASAFVPLSAYLTYVVLTVSYDVDQNCPGPNRPVHGCCRG